ncbi:5'-nucleotidase C-terminal domain-containing protein [uncultured Paraglaciecola sp.]|uniref:bifunctional metallophosphatase/5'-nucleotidase n=1 Tax=uncultured Paraglaciecola sp. TaxID=1765024 RepID=UPI0030DBF898
MFKRLRLLTLLHAILLSMVISAAPSNEKQLTLVFAGNMPDIGINTYGSYADLAGLLEKVRTAGTPTIFTFVGGSLGPSPLSSLDRGSHIIDILNTLEPDLMTLNKREFSFFEDELTLRSYEAAFPIVSSNLYDPLINNNLEGILSSLIVEKDNIKVGFISILDEEVVEEYLLKRIKVFEPRKIIGQLNAELRQKGAELVVLVYTKERDYYQTLLSDKQIDFALRLSSTGDSSNSPLNKVYAISYQEPFKLLQISWKSSNQEKNLSIQTSSIDYADLPNEHTTSTLVDEYNQRLTRLLNQKIGFFGNALNTSRNLVRSQEMPFGNFITDSLRHYAQTDIALINGGFIRGNKSYTKGGIISRSDIMTELPFRTHLNVVTLTGNQIRQLLEKSVSEVELAKGRFLQVSGLSFTYSIKQPAGERVTSILVNGSKLNSQQVYSVATSDYLARGGDGYDTFNKAVKQEDNTQKTPLISDIVIHVIQQQKTIFPMLESRIKRMPE